MVGIQSTVGKQGKRMPDTTVETTNTLLNGPLEMCFKAVMA